jgi:hypothetical protein
MRGTGPIGMALAAIARLRRISRENRVGADLQIPKDADRHQHHYSNHHSLDSHSPLLFGLDGESQKQTSIKTLGVTFSTIHPLQESSQGFDLSVNGKFYDMKMRIVFNFQNLELSQR